MSQIEWVTACRFRSTDQLSGYATEAGRAFVFTIFDNMPPPVVWLEGRIMEPLPTERNVHFRGRAERAICQDRAHAQAEAEMLLQRLRAIASGDVAA